MDEVEAALDDVNLHRFLDLVHEFRDEAQLLDRDAPEAHDGGGRLPLRRLDAAGRLEPGREPAHQRRPAGGLTDLMSASVACSPRRSNDPGLVERVRPEGRAVVAVLDRLPHHRRQPRRPTSPTRWPSRSASSSSCSSRGSWCGSRRVLIRPVGEAPERWRREAGVDARRCGVRRHRARCRQARRTQRAETIGAVLRSIVTIVIWSIAVAHDPRDLGINLGTAHRGRRDRRRRAGLRRAVAGARLPLRHVHAHRGPVRRGRRDRHRCRRRAPSKG